MCSSDLDRKSARIIFSEAVLYLAAAPKSNSAYLAVDRAMKAIEEGELQPVPHQLRPDGSGYLYPHDDPRHWLPQKYLEVPRRFYHPGSLGYEERIASRLRRLWRRFSKGRLKKTMEKTCWRRNRSLLLRCMAELSSRRWITS